MTTAETEQRLDLGGLSILNGLIPYPILGTSLKARAVSGRCLPVCRR